ncbi:MAG: DUF2183 domain-containing protein [Rhodothermales bacterium]
MDDWKPILHRVAHNAEQHFDALKARLSRRLQETRDVQLVVYRSFGTSEAVRVQGRALYHEGDLKALDNDTVWQNILNAYKRFESDEIPDLPLELRFAGTTVRTATDGEGYFDVTIDLSESLPTDRAWHPVQVEVPEGPHADTATTGQVMIPPSNARFGVISDIDDTVLQTGATSLLTMARLTFLGNSRTRLPFEGAAVFYDALCRGPLNEDHNPLLFVSSSPWNLYDFLIDFLEFQHFPLAPVLLRDLGLDATKFIKAAHNTHKSEKINRILDTYPGLPFILIGDSGQHDPEIYREAVANHPGRIAAVYIRDVSLDEARDTAIDAITSELEVDGVPFLRVSDSFAAAKHAASIGLISEDGLERVKLEVALPNSDAPQLEETLDASA